MDLKWHSTLSKKMDSRNDQGAFKVKQAHTYLEISPSLHRAPKNLGPNVSKVEEEKINVVLKPFAPKQHMIFKNVLANTRVTQDFTITNPDAFEVNVTVSFTNASLQVQPNVLKIPPKTAMSLDLTWNPTECGSTTDTIHIKDNKGRRCMISVAMTAVARPIAKAKRTIKVAGQKPKVSKAPLQKRPAWVDDIPSKREALKALASYCDNEKIDDENNALRRETFLVSDKENNSCGILPRTPAKAKMSIDSLDASPAAAMIGSSSKWAKNILNQFNMSPLDASNVFLVNAQQPNITFSMFDDGTVSPSYDTRRCSTSVKKVPLPELVPGQNIAPRELFSQEMSPVRDVTDLLATDRRESSETFILDRRASNETYIADQRLSMDTYVLSNSSLDVAQSPIPRDPTPVLENVAEETLTELEVFKNATTPLMTRDELRDTILSLEDQSRTKTRLTRKRLSSILDAIKMTPLRSRDLNYQEDIEQFDVNAMKVQNCAAVTMTISPPKKMKLPALADIERISQNKDTAKKQGSCFKVSEKATYVPFGQKKLKLAPEVKVESEAKVAEQDFVSTELVYFKVAAPGLLENPFFKNPLLTDKICSDYEAKFTKWLNNVLTPPEELESIEVKVNAAEIWARSVKMEEEFSLAPSKEIVSSRYLSVKSRLDQLRYAAKALFNRADIKNVMCTVVSRVDSGNIKIRADKTLHLDQGLKHGALKLFMSYNPLWLRIGLEIVCDTLIPMKSHTDLNTLTYFLIERVLSPKAVLGISHAFLDEKNRIKFNKFVTKKFLMLVYLLDQAKNSQLIRHDPCLFLRNSDVKSSKEMLISFSRLLLAGEGDITRHLGYMNYKVTHVQGYLHEFNYCVKFLGIDIRDGVRITRVVELITGADHLVRKLRVPAVSKLQKIHNVELALKGLAEAGCEVKNLTSNDIVMGHKEKTLSLLWQIIHNYQAPRMDKAARLIQSWWLRPTLKTALERKATRQKRAAAAVVLQKTVRGFLARRHVLQSRAKLLQQNLESRSARIIQRAFRCFLLRNIKVKPEFQAHHHEAACIIQNSFRAYMARCTLRRLKVEAAIRKAALRESSALKLQTFMRRVVAVKQMQVLKRQRAEQVAAATKLQSAWRRYATRRQRHCAAITLQSHWRGRHVRLELKKRHLAASVVQMHVRCFLASRRLFHKRTGAAMAIQKIFRGFVARKQLAGEKRAAVVLQCAFRQHLARRQLQHLKSLKKQQHKAATVIQSALRGCWVRKQLARETRAAVLIQSAVRRMQAQKLLSRMHQEKTMKMNHAATSIQRVLKGYLVRKRLVLERGAATKMQSVFRGYLVRKHMAQKRSAAIVLQCAYRQYTARHQLHHLKSLKQQQHSAALIIQKVFRGCLVRKQLVRKAKAAVLIQSAFRRMQAQKLLHHMRAEKMSFAATTVQRVFKGYLVRKRLCLEREAATKLQSIFRGRQTRKQFAENRRAALVLQCAFRRHAARRHLQHLRSVRRQHQAAVAIQSAFRGFKVRKQLAKKSKAAVLIQSAFRRMQAQKLLQQMLSKKMNSAATTIQRVFKGYLVRKRLMQERKAATKVQKVFRGYVTRKVAKQQQAAAVVIQCAVRRFLASKTLSQLVSKKVEEIKALRLSAALVIQSAWRCYSARRALQILRSEELERRHCAAQCIQTSWRCYKARMQLNKLKKDHSDAVNAAAVLQRAWRMRQARRTVAVLRMQLEQRRSAAALILQGAWRCSVARKRLSALRAERSQAELSQRAAVTIQTWFRTQREIRALKKHAQSILQAKVRQVEAASVLQQGWRRFVQRKQLKIAEAERQRKEKAARVLQSAMRHWLQRRAISKMRFLHHHLSQAEQLTCQKLLLRRDAQLSTLVPLVKMLDATYKRKSVAASIIQLQFRQYKNSRTDAATKLQAMWRGYTCRKKIKQAVLRSQAVLLVDHHAHQNIHLNQKAVLKLLKKHDTLQESYVNIKEHEKIGNKILFALNNWQQSYNFEIGTYAFFNNCLQSSSTFVSLVLPGVQLVVNGFNSNNRSVPAMKLAVLASEIILCVAKHWEGLQFLQNVENLVETVIMNMSVSVASDEILFLNCCTILWVLAHDDSLKEKILRQANLKFTLTAIENKVKRIRIFREQEMPSLKPLKQPKRFANKLHAFRELIKILDL